MIKSLIFFLVIAVIAIFVLGALKRAAKKRNSDRNEPVIKEIEPTPYFRKTVLTEPEQILFHRLREALPEQIVLAQVAMNAMVGIRKTANWQSQFNAISKKYVDFVICLQDLSIVCVVELDERSHEKADRVKSDEIKNTAFEAVGYPIVRFHVKDMPSIEKIREVICH